MRRIEAIEAALGLASLASFYASSALGIERSAPVGWILLLALLASLMADLISSWRER